MRFSSNVFRFVTTCERRGMRKDCRYTVSGPKNSQTLSCRNKIMDRRTNMVTCKKTLLCGKLDQLSVFKMRQALLAKR